ncbi:MAG: 1,4-dihydroxy-2-naphthoate polyprenyltransferase [Myxococcota bacterium]
MISTSSQVSPLRAWLTATRPKTLSAAVIPVMVGTVLAARDGLSHWPSAVLALLGAIAIQVGTNLHNDVSDFERCTDDEARLGPPRAAQMGWLTPRALRIGTLVAFGLAVVAGSWLMWRGGWPIVGIGVLSILSGLAYTGGPAPLAYVGIADFFVFLFFGVVAVAGTYYVQALALTSDVLLAGSAFGLLSTAILVVNNLRDREGDARSKKRTLVVRFGTRFGHLEYLLCLAGAFGLFAAMAQTDPGLWITWAGVPFAVVASHRIVTLAPEQLNPWLGRTAALVALEGLLFVVGVLWSS